MKKRFFFTILALTIFISGAQAQTGSVELVISGLNGQPISPTQKTIDLIPSDYISIDVVYTSEPNYYLLSIDAVASAEGAGWFDISQVTWPEGYWDIYGYVYIDVNDDLVINTFDSNDVYNIPSNGEPVTVLSNIIFHYTSLGSIHIGLADDPNDSGTQDTREIDNKSTFYVIEDFGTGLDITNPDKWPTSLQIEDGPDTMSENSEQQYNAIVYYNNSDTNNVNLNANWTADPCGLADVVDGYVTTYSVIYPQEILTLAADYTEGNITVSDSVDIVVETSLSIPELLKRNLDDAKKLKEAARENLLQARQTEAASFYILRDLQWSRDFSDFNVPELYNSRLAVFIAILQERISDRIISASIKKLTESETILGVDQDSP